MERLRLMGRHLPSPIGRALRPVGQRLWGAALPEPIVLPPGPSGRRAAPVVPPRLESAPRPAPLSLPSATPGREPLVVWPADPPLGYLGQLSPDFQRELAQRWDDVQLEDCFFYHSALLPDGSFVEGPWDLIDNEGAYLGGIDLAGRRVLEFGPATGWLTLWMCQQGAAVVIIDIGWDLSTDLIPLATFDLEETHRQQVAFASRVANSWWYLRQAYGHSAQAVYAPVYDLPKDLGRYDVSIFGSLLLHLRDPFMALAQAAAVTDDTMVVVDQLQVPAEDIERPVLFWNPTHGASPNGWWLLSPGVIIDMLDVLGFPDARVTYHRQFYTPEGDSELANEVPMYTVVARRR
jgi:O-methyltransferase